MNYLAYFTEVPRNRVSGVYVLTLNGEAVYVGQSRNVVGRIETHFRARKGKRFDRAFWLEVDPAELDQWEGALIRALNPVYNTKANGSPNADAALLERIGLKPDPTDTFRKRCADEFRRIALANPRRAT